MASRPARLFDIRTMSADIKVMDIANEGRARLGATQRTDQILDVAERLVLEAGALPIPMKRVGEMTGASRALVYVYFPDSEALARAVLRRQIERLISGGLGLVSLDSGVIEAVRAACAIYMDHVAQNGPLVSIILRDLSPGASRQSGLLRILARLAGGARRELRLTPHEAVVFIELMSAIPEEAGRLVFTGELTLADGQALSTRLVASSIASVAPAAANASRPSD